MHPNKEDQRGNAIVWLGQPAGFLTTVMLFGQIHDNIDELGTAMLKKVVLDKSPYKDFRSMRLALEDQLDPEEFGASEVHRLKQDLEIIDMLTTAGISPSPSKAEHERLIDVLNFLHATGISPQTLRPLQPPNAFVEIPDDPKQPLIWKGALELYTALMIWFTLGETKGSEDDARLFAEAAEHYSDLIKIDQTPYPDYRTLFKAHYKAFNSGKALKKLERAADALDKAEQQYVGKEIKPYTPFMLQAMFNEEAANALHLRCPDPAVDYYYVYYFDALFIGDELIDEVLRSRKK
ncbi:hypothetical protein [Paraflavitalea sp. CAU 1676]|uniref:hypothetical protein n=1 Tax=Paraflavitalea sp. CAU 1676 TaxID=3032598 RepID=UPI0023DA5FFE|nr:hypothetical protein [Paraflavitalea sp. CAU 1676]MDF2189143.1 hypothetical protein [Paraflavitalea sp. CAU 1676]